MCFSAEMSLAFSILGMAAAAWIERSNGNSHLLKGVVYFVLMETLQFVQYQFIADDIDPENPTLAQMRASPQCRSQANQFLTFLGFLHIAFQPYYSAKLSCAFVSSKQNMAQFSLVQRLQLLGGVWFLSRHLLTYVDLVGLGFDPRYAFDPASWKVHDVEWLSGPWLCTYKGLHHLAWSVPMVPVSYYSPGMQLHAFLMFAPFFAMDHGSLARNIGNYVAGVLLFVTGPLLADYVPL
eukprot:TRINITY_DN3181_c0_g1_i9.p1 TRINITY_DN3181_c0_g1~~TRINITY_DN3181_c0_g1_i9.p1  ORF type:complete len:237 (-),score=53.12 TRINITY_DN3181_c0_g1_i9:456-1166(-)